MTNEDNKGAGTLTQRRGAAGKGASGSGNAVSTRTSGPKQHNGMFQFYQDEQGGLRVSPTTVLICALIFMACVVSMHIVGKLRGV